jgi:hypothetical protein
VQRNLEGCDRWGVGRGILYSKSRWSSGEIYAPGGPSSGQKRSILFLDYSFYFAECSEAAMGGGGAQRPVWHVNEPKKTGARSARARTRGQNPLVTQYQGWCEGRCGN